MDQLKNFVKVAVSGFYGASDTIIDLKTGEGAKLPDPANGGYNLVWYNASDFGDPSDDPFVEVVRIVSKTNDRITIIRSQEGTTASPKNKVGKQFKMILAATVKVLHDIQNDTNATLAAMEENLNNTLSTMEKNINDRLDSMNGKTLILSTPTDNTFQDGLLPFTSNTNITDAVDEVNEILSELAPSRPDIIGELNTGNLSSVEGRLSGNLTSDWYQNNKNAGDIVPLITGFPFFIYASQPDRGFGPGDQGVVSVLIKNGNNDFTSVASIDLGANFDESLRNSQQNISAWPNSGVYTFTEGSLQIVSVSKYNNFKKWQQCITKTTITSLLDGYNAIKLNHNGQDSNVFSIWQENASNSLSISQLTIKEVTVGTHKYTSGIPHYTSNDIFSIGTSISGLYTNVFAKDNIASLSLSGCSPVNIPATVQNKDTVVNILQNMTINQSNAFYSQLSATVTAKHPLRATSNSANFNSAGAFVSTYGNMSTDKAEYFYDENRRLPIGNYLSAPANIIGQWNSTNLLTSGNALVLGGSLKFAKDNYSSYKPDGCPNYTSLATDAQQLYLRAFKDTVPHSNVSLTVGNLAFSSMPSKIKIEVKLPGVTGWLDASKPFSAYSFSGIDGDGCLVTNSGNILNLTFGTFSTYSSGSMIIVRVTLIDKNISINSLLVNW
jgi:hypothetical protein